MLRAPSLAAVLMLLLAGCAAPPIAAPSPLATASTPASTSAQPTVTPGLPSATPDTPLAIESCGKVAKVIADGAQMVVDIVADGVTTQYNLQNQFAYPKDSAPGQADVIRAAQDVLYRLMLRGGQVAPDPGLPNTIQLRDFVATKVVRCETIASIQPKPNAFVLPPGCGYVGSPTAGTDYSAWKFDCGDGANHDARGAFAYSLAQQGWTGCGVGLGSGTWKKGDLRLIVSEGSGVPGPSGLPTLTQPARPGGTACG